MTFVLCCYPLFHFLFSGGIFSDLNLTLVRCQEESVINDDDQSIVFSLKRVYLPHLGCKSPMSGFTCFNQHCFPST